METVFFNVDSKFFFLVLLFHFSNFILEQLMFDVTNKINENKKNKWLKMSKNKKVDIKL